MLTFDKSFDQRYFPLYHIKYVNINSTALRNRLELMFAEVGCRLQNKHQTMYIFKHQTMYIFKHQTMYIFNHQTMYIFNHQTMYIFNHQTMYIFKHQTMYIFKHHTMYIFKHQTMYILYYWGWQKQAESSMLSQACTMHTCYLWLATCCYKRPWHKERIVK